MATQIGSRKSVYSVTKTIPRIPVDALGRQGRASTGVLRISPGMSEAMEFVWGDMDGIAVSLVDSVVVLAFWTPKKEIETHEIEETGYSDLVLLKRVKPSDPYRSTVTFTLTADDTRKISNARKEIGSVLWGIYLETSDGNWPAAVKSDGSRFGSVVIDTMGNIPDPEILNSHPSS